MRIVKTGQKPEKPSDKRVARLRAAGASARQAAQDGGEQAAAWVEIEAGRYQPRRIRGSFRGRELG
jgi:hypothetical protein